MDLDAAAHHAFIVFRYPANTSGELKSRLELPQVICCIEPSLRAFNTRSWTKSRPEAIAELLAFQKYVGLEIG